MERREILIVGIHAPNLWKKADASANQDIIDHLGISILIALVFEKKLKVFGYDRQGILRSICWELPKYYKTTNLSVLEDLKLDEAQQILKNYFSSFPVDINILEKATA